MQTKYFPNKIIMLLILLMFGSIAQGQKEKVDSLKKSYKADIDQWEAIKLKRIDSVSNALQIQKDTTRVNTLNELANSYRLYRTDTTLIIAAQAYREGEKLNHRRGMARATLITMLAYMNLGNLNKYEEYARRTVPFYQELKNYQYLISSYRRIGEILDEKCKYKEAIEYYNKGMELAPKTGKGSNWHLTTFYIAIGNSMRKSGNFEKAYEYYKKGLEQSSKLKNADEITTAVAYAHEAMGDLYLQFDDFETAKYYYDKCPEMIFEDEWNATRYKAMLSLAKKNYDSALNYYNIYYENTMREFKRTIQDPLVWHGYSFASNFMYGGPVYVGLKRYDQAIEYLKPSLQFFTENGQTSRRLDALKFLSKAYFGKNELAQALQYGNELIKVAEDVEVKPRLRDGYQLLSEIHEKIGDKDKANLYYRKYSELKDQIKTDEFKQKLQLYKAEEREKQKLGAIEQLKKEKRWLTSGIILLAISIASFFGLVWMQRKYNAKKRLLQANEMALKHAEDEKKIALLEMMSLRSQMNPHFIFNCLNSINRFVLRNDTEAASGYLTKFSKLMRMVLENSKQSLIPLEEEVKCLELYIQMEQFRCKNSFTYYIKYHDGVDTEEAMIPPLLLQPFVENAIWHGVNPKEGDGRIGIEFFQKEETLYCVIKDNGIGRKKASELKSQLSEHHKSMGLQITKERLAIMGEEQSNGSPVEIEDLYDENSNAVGTKVTIRIFSLPAFEELKSSLNL